MGCAHPWEPLSGKGQHPTGQAEGLTVAFMAEPRTRTLPEPSPAEVGKLSVKAWIVSVSGIPGHTVSIPPLSSAVSVRTQTEHICQGTGVAVGLRNCTHGRWHLNVV